MKGNLTNLVELFAYMQKLCFI